MAFNLMEALQKIIPSRTVTIKPGDTTQTLQDRLGLTSQQAQTAVKGGTGSFVPTTALPIKTQPTSALPLTTDITTGQIKYSPAVGVPTQPTIQPQAQPAAQPVSTGVSEVQPVQAPSLQEQLNALTKTAQGLQAEVAKGITPIAPTVSAYKSALGEKTPTEIYTEMQRKAYEPYFKAQAEYIESLKPTEDTKVQFKQILDDLGLTQLDKELEDTLNKAQTIENQMSVLPEDVKRRVSDFLITQGQYERLTQAELKPLTTFYNTLSQAYQKGSALYGRRYDIAKTLMREIENNTARKQKALEAVIKGAETLAGFETGLAEQAYKQATAVPEAPKTISTPTGTYQWTGRGYELISETEVQKKGEGLREEVIGNFRILRDSAGNIISTREIGATEGGGFTELENKKLEQADLTSAPRQQQLDYLYGGIPAPGTIEKIKQSTKTLFEELKNVGGYTRKEIENQWKADNGTTELNPVVKDLLDDLFPEESPWWKFWD